VPINPMDLGGGRVLVTGASSGIGRETAILLSQLNARVVLVARNRERLGQTAALLEGDGHTIEVFDLRSVTEIPGWMKRLTVDGGPLRGLVHSAGVLGTYPLRILDPERLDEVMAINFGAAVALTRAFCQAGNSAPESSVVFLASILGIIGRPATAAYAASKGALIGLTKALGVELARERIRVNCVAPAMVQGEMLDQFVACLTPEQQAANVADHPLGLGSARDVANGIAFLIADTGRWITGTTMFIDGGFTAR
jgi:NAD(P)-dependent dehydrogenase (short-subunit alcohol dehydrogenase family)